MEKILLFIKTYKPDFNQCKRLLDSITKHNKDGIKVLISVNDGDYDYFKKVLFVYSWETQRESQKHRQKEKQALRRELDVGLNPGSRDHTLSQRQKLNR